MRSGPALGDIFPAALLTSGVLAGVVRAQRSGKGSFVDVSMYNAITSLRERIVYQYSVDGRGPEKRLHSPFASLAGEAHGGGLSVKVHIAFVGRGARVGAYGSHRPVQQTLWINDGDVQG